MDSTFSQQQGGVSNGNSTGTMDGGSSYSSGAAPSKAGSAAPPRALRGTQAETQLTPREFEALRKIKRNVDRTKTAGWLLGGGGTYYALTRRKVRPGNLQLAGMTFLGGLCSSFILMPFGVLISKNYVNDVEDPQHLKRVLAGAVEEKRRGQVPNIRVAPPQGMDGEQAWAQPASDQTTPATSGNGFGVNSYSSPSPSGSRHGATAATAALFESIPDAAGLDTFDARSNGPTSDNGDGQQSTSRWAQLRGERGVEPSKWEKIRQENARNAIARRGSQALVEQQQQQDSQDRFSASSGSIGLPASRNGNADSDPRWSSPPTAPQGSARRPPTNEQLDGWGSAEFVQESSGNPYGGRGGGGQRSFNINSVDEDGYALRNLEVDSGAPMKVAKGSLLAALSGAVSGSVYGVFKGQTGAGTMLASRMAFNLFAFGFPFFAVREYAINPALAVIARENSYDHPTTQLSYVRPRQNQHTRDLASSGLSGAIVGGSLAGYARGRQSIPSGIIMFGLACTGLQLAGNELRVARGKLLTRQSARPPAHAAAIPASSHTAANESLYDRRVDETKQAVAAVAAPTQAPSSASGAKGSGGDWLSSLKKYSPVKSLSDEEYEQKLKERLESVGARAAAAREELQELEREQKKESEASVHVVF